MKLLALDTTQEMCSVALSIGNDLIFREELAPRSHTQLILPQAQAVLAEAGIQLYQLDSIAFGRGPGSFTGLRIAAGVVQGLALGADIPVVPVSSLAAMAQGAYRDDTSVTSVCAAFDARIKEVYWGNYQVMNDLMVSVSEEAVNSPDEVVLPGEGLWVATGSAWSAYPQIQARLSSRLALVEPDRVPLARDIIPLAQHKFAEGHVVAAEDATPVYLRSKVAKTKAERRAASGAQS